MLKKIAAIGLVLTLGACAHNEAGRSLDGGTFGNATLNNSQIHTGDRNFTVQLAQRFASDVPTTVNFAFDSTVLDPSARAALDQQANWIRQFPEVRFRVYGHTDAVGSSAYNKRLGLRRARAVVNYLTRHGISRSRLEAVVSHGETRPLIVTQNRERRNRRTVTEVNGFIKRHPTLLDGKYAEVVYREYIKSAEPRSTLSQTGSFATTSQ